MMPAKNNSRERSVSNEDAFGLLIEAKAPISIMTPIASKGIDTNVTLFLL